LSRNILVVFGNKTETCGIFSGGVSGERSRDANPGYNRSLITDHQKFSPSENFYGRGAGVGRALGVGPDLGVGVALGVAVGVGVEVTVAVGVAVAVAVAVGVGLAVAVGVGVAPCPPGNTRT